jgi:hypothetical protein
MQELLLKIPDFVQVFALIGMVLSLTATVVVRLTPSKTDDETVSGFVAKFLKVLHWLPTIGINPQTKKLQEAYEELKAKNEPPKST